MIPHACSKIFNSDRTIGGEKYKDITYFHACLSPNVIGRIYGLGFNQLINGVQEKSLLGNTYYSFSQYLWRTLGIDRREPNAD